MDTALVVDDERFFLTILGDLVSQRLGMRPLLARDGATALSLMEKEPVDLDELVLCVERVLGKARDPRLCQPSRHGGWGRTAGRVPDGDGVRGDRKGRLRADCRLRRGPDETGARRRTGLTFAPSAGMLPASRGFGLPPSSRFRALASSRPGSTLRPARPFPRFRLAGCAAS